LLTARAPPFYDIGSGVHAVHMGHLAKAQQKTHTCAVAATEINAPLPCANAGLCCQILGRCESTQVDLFAHDKFPEISLWAGVHRLYLDQADVLYTLHDNTPDNSLFISVD